MPLTLHRRIFLYVLKGSFTKKPEAEIPEDSVLYATGSDIPQREREKTQTGSLNKKDPSGLIE